METIDQRLSILAAVVWLVLALAVSPVCASSHMDAPLITLDDPANTTDVYAFVTGNDAAQSLTTALAVHPFEEPGIGPNNFRFDDQVLYEIHIALGKEDIKAGRATLTYQFRFETRYKVEGTILQAFLGPLEGVIDEEGFDENQNLRQTYKVTKLDQRKKGPMARTRLGSGRVPPNNQGLLTRFYNQNDNGENPAKGGVSSEADLDMYTKRAIFDLKENHRVFAGQRDDGFYADIQAIFDGLDFTGPNKPFDSQGGYNVHTIVLQIPFSELAGAETVGVYASTSRQRVRVLSKKPEKYGDLTLGRYIQVARQGNPLFNEGFVPLARKDLYSRTDPGEDMDLFLDFALAPQLASALGLPDENRTDIAAIFIPDLIKVDLTTGPVPLPGQSGFSRLSIFGGDSGGFPNGRRFGDDVLDIAVLALAQATPPVDPATNVDGVPANDITFNQVFPYAATPLNGRNHPHH